MEVKFKAGQKVYWLSGNNGFVSGFIKTIRYEDSVTITKDGTGKMATVGKRRTNLLYYCWHEGNVSEYQGDLVKENEIFTSKKEMIEYYAQKDF